jgi:magnesium chelatase subunit ChlI-like protein
VSLAHHRVLLLDELPKFKREMLGVLRQPLEDGKTAISRATPGSGLTLALRSRPRPHLFRPPPDDHGDESLPAPRMGAARPENTGCAAEDSG